MLTRGVVQCMYMFFGFFPSHRLVSGAGEIKLTKDGNVLLHEMVRTTQTSFQTHSYIHKADEASQTLPTLVWLRNSICMYAGHSL